MGDDVGSTPPERRSISALAAELADLRRRINDHRAFLAWLDGRLRARTGRTDDTSDPGRQPGEVTA